MKKLIGGLSVLVILGSSPEIKAEDYTLAVALQGITDPHIVGGVKYDPNAVQKYQAVLTANVVGPKLGSLPCYASGVGVGLGTVAPGLEDAPIAAWSFPLLTCAPFGEQVVAQVGLATPLNGGGDRSYYFGLGVSLSGGPNQLKAKRVARLKAKEAKKKADLSQGPVPSTGS